MSREDLLRRIDLNLRLNSKDMEVVRAKDGVLRAMKDVVEHPGTSPERLKEIEDQIEVMRRL